MPQIEDFKKIPTLLYMHFSQKLPRMIFLFCYKGGDKHYIFQEVRGLPAKGVIASEIDYTIGCASSWSSWDNVDALIVDANKEEVEIWRDLMGHTRPYNSYPNSFGAQSSHWRSMARASNPKFQYGKTGKNKHRKFDTFFEFRVQQVRAFYLYLWGFEIISDSISCIGVDHKHMFPYEIENHGQTARGYEYVEMDWSGMHFVRTEPRVGDTTMDSRGAVPEGFPSPPISWWRREEVTTEDNFDEEMAQMFETRKEHHRSLDIGQRKTMLDLTGD